MNLWSRHHVHIPWSALRKIGKAASEMMVVASVIDSTHFKVSSCEGTHTRTSRVGQVEY